MTRDDLIALLMRETGCTRNAAITALRIMADCQSPDTRRKVS